MTGILIRRGKETQKGKMATRRHGDMGRMSRSDRGRGQSYTRASLGTDGNARSEEKGMEQSLPQILQGQRGPANTVISDLQPPGLRKVN